MTIEKDYEHVARALLDRIAELELLIVEQKTRLRPSDNKIRELEDLLQQNKYCYAFISQPPTSKLQ